MFISQFMPALLLALIQDVVAGTPTWSPTTWKPLENRNFSGSPCAAVSASASAALVASPSVTPSVDGQLAFDCLNSVSLHSELALQLVTDIMPYVEWQTDLSYLKDPPSGYQEPAVDIIAGFDQVTSNIQSGVYANEYAFMDDLWKVFNSAHDGHFRFLPDILIKAVQFRRNVDLVSVSMDGVEIPKIYTHSDIIEQQSGSGFTPSHVILVDGEDVVKVIEDLGQLGVLQDRDASWNTMFFSKAFNSSAPWGGYFFNSGRYGSIYPGPNTTLMFANGSEAYFTTTALVVGDFTNVTDGESFYQTFCTGLTPVIPVAKNTTNTTMTPFPPGGTPNSTAQPAGYPKPLVVSSDLQVSGYFLNDSDVAVLSMVSFEPDFPAEFQAVVQTLIAEAKAAGKTKLVIDLSANGGGIILQGYDTFRQLFPQIVQQDFTRYRESETFLELAREFAVLIPSNFSEKTADEDLLNMFSIAMDYRYDYDIDEKHFKTFDDKFEPAVFNGDNFTQLMRWDLNDPLTTINFTFGLGMDVTGYRSRQNFTQPFAAEDIVMLYDGYCASTCTLFSEFMRLQAGVQSIFIGGRPSTNITQAIGGVKGANNFGYDVITLFSDLAQEYASPSQFNPNTSSSAFSPPPPLPASDPTVPVNGTGFALPNLSKLLTLSEYPQNRSTDNSLNVRDNILPPNLGDGVPAQFILEEADCRIFYTPEMIVDISAMWKAAADMAWGGKACVAGSINGGEAKKRGPVKRVDKRAAELAERERQAAWKLLMDVRKATAGLDTNERDALWEARHVSSVPY